jgi:hypothetical protein
MHSWVYMLAHARMMRRRQSRLRFPPNGTSTVIHPALEDIVIAAGMLSVDAPRGRIYALGFNYTAGASAIFALRMSLLRYFHPSYRRFRSDDCLEHFGSHRLLVGASA